jgi:plastocyanin
MKRHHYREEFLKKYVVPATFLGALFCVGMLISVALLVKLYVHQKQSAAGTEVVSSNGRVGLKPPTEEIVQRLKASKGFQVLVMYTDDGFVPATSTIKKGQTIRFTNNSTRNVWVAEVTDLNTPTHPNLTTCDVPFNSCMALKPTEFQEFTFPATGTFAYIDNIATNYRGMVVIK